MKRPIIGITPSQQNNYNQTVLKKHYSEAVRAAGGLPVVLPVPTVHNHDQEPRENDHKDLCAEEYLDILDGLLLSGGMDLDPLTWGEEPLNGLKGIDPERDNFELALLAEALQQQKPVLGICKGCQLINIAAGGTLYQDLALQAESSQQHAQQAPRWYPGHRVQIEPETLLHQIVGRAEIKVNSFHHQAIRELAPGYRAAARAADGVIEAIEKEDSIKNGGFLLGVQWHPEAMWSSNHQALRLFEEFIRAARH